MKKNTCPSENVGGISSINLSLKGNPENIGDLHSYEEAVLTNEYGLHKIDEREDLGDNEVLFSRKDVDVLTLKLGEKYIVQEVKT